MIFLASFCLQPLTRKTGHIFFILIFVSLLLTSAFGFIRLDANQDDDSLSPTMFQLLSSFDHCIVFIFEWGLETGLSAHGNIKHFLFYSELLNCAVIVDTYIEHGNVSHLNPRFNDEYSLESHLIFTRYVTVLINLYPSPEAPSSIRNSKDSHYLWSILVRYNLPFNYVLFFMNLEQDEKYADTFSRFAEVSSPAVFILILNELEVYLMGFANAHQAGPAFFRLVVFREAQIRQLHREIHSDLQRSPIKSMSLRPHTICRFGWPDRCGPSDCAFALLIENFNLTFCGNVPDDFTGGCEREEISRAFTDVIIATPVLRSFSRKSRYTFDYIGYAVYWIEFNFICIAQTDTMGLKAFVQAFDPLTWIVTATVCICMTGTIAAMSVNVAASFYSKFQTSAASVLTLLIERFYAHGPVMRAASREIVLVVSIWAFGAMLLSMCYSGNMVSELTSPSLLTVPHNMHELAMAGYPVLTKIYVVTFKEGKKVAQSWMHSKIDDYLTHQQNGTLANTLQKFRKILTFVNSTPVISKMKENSSKVLSVFAGATGQVKSYGVWSLIHGGGGKRAITSSILPFFSTPMPILLHTNFMLPQFRSFLSQVFESGAWKYFEDDAAADILYKELSKKVNMNGTTEFKETWTRNVNHATIWRDFSPFLNERASWDALTVHNLSPAFQFLGICLIVSSLVMLNDRYPLKLAVRVLIRYIRNAMVITHRKLNNFSLSLR